MLASSWLVSLENVFLCCSTTFSKYCFSDSSLVVLLNFSVRTTPHSAQSFTHGSLVTVDSACCNDCIAGQSSTTALRKLSSHPVVSKNIRDTCSWATLDGKSFIRCGPRCQQVFVCHCLTAAMKKMATVAISGLRYHECLAIIFKPTVLIASSP